MTYQQAYYLLSTDLAAIYDEQEAAAIAHELLLHITGLNKLQRLTDKNNLLSPAQQSEFNDMKRRLLLGEPLQYIIATAWFMGRSFLINEHVLIPRPETEELVQWIIDDWEIVGSPISVFDVGTGSGCIPITLKLALPTATLTSCDVSTSALSVAQHNAAVLHADIQLLQLDFLDMAQWITLPRYDVIVSNPPYIPMHEREQMHRNVKDFEPALALFVPDHNPLLFYKALSDFGKQHLNGSGSIYCELSATYAYDTQQLFQQAGYTSVTLRIDMHGNPRMLKAML